MMMTLEERKAAYQNLVATNPRDGSMRATAEYLAGDEQYLLPQHIQGERDIRRLALHRVEEAIDDLDKKELKKFVVYLIEQSKRRQEEDEQKYNTLIGTAKKASKDETWVRSVAQLNRLQLLFADGVHVRCWCCKNRPIPVFTPFLFWMWALRLGKRWLGIRHR